MSTASLTECFVSFILFQGNHYPVMKQSDMERAEFEKFLSIYNSIENPDRLVPAHEVLVSLAPHGFPNCSESIRGILRSAFPLLVPAGVDPSQFADYLFGVPSIIELEQLSMDRGMMSPDCPRIEDLETKYRVFFENVREFRDLLYRFEFLNERQLVKTGEDRVMKISITECRYFLNASGSILIEPTKSPLTWGFANFSRVKSCLVCKKIYVQTRTDQKYCSENCRNSLQQKNWYAKHKEKVLARKRDQYLEHKRNYLCESSGFTKTKEAKPSVDEIERIDLSSSV